jgi:hypothetical protein
VRFPKQVDQLRLAVKTTQAAVAYEHARGLVDGRPPAEAVALPVRDDAAQRRLRLRPGGGLARAQVLDHLRVREKFGQRVQVFKLELA